MPPRLSPSSSFSSTNGMKPTKHNDHDQSTPRSAKEMLLDMIESVERDDLKQAMKVEIKRIFANHDRLLTMLQTRSEALEQENFDYKTLAADHQRRYEKAVREMQFFRQKYERAKEINSQYAASTVQRQHSKQQQHQHQHQHLPRSLSIESESSGEGAEQPSGTYQQHQHPSSQQKNNGGTPIQSYPLTPTSPQPSVLPHELALFASYDLSSTDFGSVRQKSTLPSRSSSTSTNTHGNIPPQWSLGSTDVFDKPHTSSLDDTVSSISRLRQNSTTNVSVHSSHSSTTESSSFASSLNTSTNNDNAHKDKSSRKKQSWQLLQPAISSTGMGSSPSAASSTFSSSKESTGGSVTSSISSTGAVTGTVAGTTTVQSVPMTPVRSSTATNGYTGASLIQQRRVDPLIFGGSDGLWDTISKSKGSDVTVEKMISNFLRRGGSPNTAKQSPSNNAIVKYGFGMVHALVATKASGSLDLLLQQGGNPNAMTLSTVEEDKCSALYLAAKVGWLAGLQKLVQAGGDLMNARGGGVKNKTSLHVAAEYCHAAVVEYIVGATQSRLNLEVDSLGASVLHYACASGHTDLVLFLARSCKIPVHQEDHRGELPLHWAARHGRLEVVTLLVERCGCDCNPYVPRKVGTPLDLARAGGHRRLVDYLKGLGAMTAKKMEKRREEERTQETPVHLESTLTRNGLFGMDDDDF